MPCPCERRPTVSPASPPGPSAGIGSHSQRLTVPTRTRLRHHPGMVRDRVVLSVSAVPGGYAAEIRSVTVQSGENEAAQPPRVRRRDRHGRGLRGRLVPPAVPLYRTRSQQFDDMVLDAVARLEPRWESELSDVEFAVQEVPDAEMTEDGVVPLARVVRGT